MKWNKPRRSSWLIAFAAAALGIIGLVPGIGGPIDRALEPIRFGVHQHQASGGIIVVELDADSAAAIRRWPWPRRNYAMVVDRLRAAGAASIVFDIDLSAPSNPRDDAILAAALARSDGLVTLPTFSQQAGSNDRRHLDALPLPAFRQHVSLASVSVSPDVDGLVRTMPLATVTAGVPRPSLSAYIAATQGRADTSFPVNFSIDPATVPRLSFVAVRDGRFDVAAVRGRNVLIGATAIEMGDRYATSVRGVLPGVVIQALASETLIAGLPREGSGLAVIVLALLLTAPIVSGRRSAIIGAALAGSTLLLSAVVLGLQHGVSWYFPLAPGLIVLLAAAVPSFARDIIGRFQKERLVDEMTGLPNQRAFLADPKNADGRIVIVQVNNLDALSAVLGPADVSQTIIRAAERLRLVSATGTVFRVGSHHLALTLAREQQVDDAVATLRTMLFEPVEVAGRKVDVAVTVGVAETEGDVAERLTDAALGAEAAAHDGTFWRRTTIDRGALERSVSLMGELDAAITAGEISVHYQPKLCLKTGHIASAEALVRWHHPARGYISPDIFIPLAEQADRIAPLTLHVLTTVLRDAASWRDVGHDVTAAINISAKLLSSSSFNSAVDRLLLDSPVPHAALIFEVTESATMSDPVMAVEALQRYRARGIAVSMDDYGTGQSTLTYLKRLPLNELKIDRSFVQHAHKRSEDALLVRSTIELAHQLGLKVVAEGIEDEANLVFLRAHGCDYAQGYFISKPVPYAAFLELLNRACGQTRLRAAG